MVVAAVTSPEEGIQVTRLTFSGEELSSERFAASVDDAVYDVDWQGNVLIVARGLDLSSCNVASAKDDEFGVMWRKSDGDCTGGNRLSKAEVGVPVVVRTRMLGDLLLLSRSGEGATAKVHLQEHYYQERISHADFDGTPHAMETNDGFHAAISYTTPDDQNRVRLYDGTTELVGEYQSPQNTLFTQVTPSKTGRFVIAIAGHDDGVPVVILLDEDMNVDWELHPLSENGAFVEPVSLVAGPELTIAFAVSGDDATLFDSTIPAGQTGVFDLAYDYGTPTPRTAIPTRGLTMVRPVNNDQMLIAGSLQPANFTDPSARSSGLDHPLAVYGALLLTNE
ncbi:MAG: hypothetical protein U0271_08385 [Polyangiaceae bacterium]